MVSTHAALGVTRFERKIDIIPIVCVVSLHVQVMYVESPYAATSPEASTLSIYVTDTSDTIRGIELLSNMSTAAAVPTFR